MVINYYTKPKQRRTFLKLKTKYYVTDRNT